MPTLRRSDGSQFIIQPYRELLSPERTSSLKRRLRLLAQNYGNCVRIFKLNDNTLEAVFSREPGFLLGETIWNYLEKPDNLIYCEALPERRQCLLLIVKNGVVFLDARMSFTNLVDEFVALSATDDEYDIYVWGDIPLSETAEENKFFFDKKNVKSFSLVEEPLLQKLPIIEGTQLQPLDMALSSPLLGKSKTLPIIITGLVLAALFLGWNFLKPSAENNALHLYKPKPVISPYANYYKALTTPSPKDQALELAMVMDLTESIPGWRLTNVSFANKTYSCTMLSEEGRLTQIQTWVDANNYKLSLLKKGVILHVPSKVGNRKKPKNIYTLHDIMAILIDDLRLITSENAVVFSNPVNRGNYKETTIQIILVNETPGKLMMLGQELSRFPVTITKIALSLNNSIIKSGGITLKVLGD